jgi:hypothetical protein
MIPLHPQFEISNGATFMIPALVIESPDFSDNGQQ